MSANILREEKANRARTRNPHDIETSVPTTSGYDPYSLLLHRTIVPTANRASHRPDWFTTTKSIDKDPIASRQANQNMNKKEMDVAGGVKLLH
jgi:hypothetical protein